MAKHIKRNQVSAGKRISCKGNVKRPAAIIVVAERVANAMHNAFLNIQIAVTGKSKVVDAILNSAKQNAGNPKAGRGWTANVAPNTLKQLIKEGVFA